MRIAVSLIALLGLSAAPAHADVFVPADPPQVRTELGDCRASAGGIELTGRPTAKGWNVRLRAAGGPWAPVTGLSQCPVLTVGADGTVVLSGSEEIVVRPPGGAFRAPLAVGSMPQVAVSPNGWIAALTYEGEETADLTLRGLTIAPDGAVTRTPELGRGQLSPGALAIDAGGNATAAWTDDKALRTARATPGARWVPGRSFVPAGSAYEVGRHVDVAVSPSGRTLLTWADDDSIQASFDGGPPETVVAMRTAGSPHAVIDDAGSALIAFGAKPGRILVVERLAGGAWSAPRAVQGAFVPSEQNELTVDEPYEPREIELRMVLAPDGRVVLAWPTWTRRQIGRLAAAAGRLGGAWSSAVALSSPIRQFAGWGLELAVDGTPRVAWDEYEDRFHTVPRAAALVADAAAPPPDGTAPEVTATLPTRAPATRAGQLRARVPVRCSEACDALLEVGGFSEVRSLEPGRTATFAVFLDGLAARPGLRRFRVRLTVSDRAGNVVARTATLRVRVLRRSLRSFKVAPGYDFATCTNGGNRRLGQLVNSIIEGLADKSLGSARQIRRAWRRGFDAIERAYPEECLGDTDVREHIYEVLDTPLTLAGYPDFYLDE